MKSKELFQQGFNCAQAVFLPFAVKHKINKDTALQIMSPFGGGLSNTDNICGAVSGGIAAIGLEFGHNQADDNETKQKCKKLTQKFILEFEKKHGGIKCTQLIGFDLSKSCEREKADDSGVFEKVCTKLVSSAEQIAKKVIKDNAKF
jgi:C_GCAxxG_C_C family probable redox protein